MTYSKASLVVHTSIGRFGEDSIACARLSPRLMMVDEGRSLEKALPILPLPPTMIASVGWEMEAVVVVGFKGIVIMNDVGALVFLGDLKKKI